MAFIIWIFWYYYFVNCSKIKDTDVDECLEKTTINNKVTMLELDDALCIISKSLLKKNCDSSSMKFDERLAYLKREREFLLKEDDNMD